jgi:hypothetical protein
MRLWDGPFPLAAIRYDCRDKERADGHRHGRYDLAKTPAVSRGLDTTGSYFSASDAAQFAGERVIRSWALRRRNGSVLPAITWAAMGLGEGDCGSDDRSTIRLVFR